MVQTNDERGYNGWPNYETWACNLWLTNVEADYKTLQLIVDCPGQDVHSKADMLSKWVSLEQDKPDYNCPVGLYTDLLQSAIERIDFRAIIRANDDGQGWA